MTERTRHQHRSRRSPQMSHINRQTNRSTARHGRPTSNHRQISNPLASQPSNLRHGRSGERSTSICYSYLIAVVSSFLVVLGLSIEAFGACTYCISNIRSSRLARQKQRINSHEFALDTNGNITNTNISNNPLRVATITQILDNRNISSNNQASSDDNPTTAITISQPDESSSQVNDHPDGRRVQDRNDLSMNERENTIVILQNQDQPHESMNSIPTDATTCATTPDQLPLDSSCQQLVRYGEDVSSSIEPPDDVRDDLRSEPNSSQFKYTDEKINSGEKAVTDNAQSQLSMNLVSQFTSRLDQSKDKASPDSVAIAVDETNASCQEQPSASAPTAAQLNDTVDTHDEQSPSPLASTSRGHSDLMNTVNRQSIPGDNMEQSIVKRKTLPNNHQRHANVRRTLVMGLSGEEEMIEIDEEDLDNMSIVPPPYESVATNNGPHNV